MGLPTSGYEVVYGVNPKWDKLKGVRNNNCYSYAMNDYKPYRRHKAVVGDLAGYKTDIAYDTCPPVEERLLKDNPGRVYKEEPAKPCKEGFYKVMMFVASERRNSGVGDFHFYKQHRDVLYSIQPKDTVDSIATFFGIPKEKVVQANGGKTTLRPGNKIMLSHVNIFSHKLGWATTPLLVDSCKNVIKDPRVACRQHSVLKYDRYCGSYCVKAHRVKTSR